MAAKKFYNIPDLKSYILQYPYEFVITCGYDNVGKGFVVDSLFEDVAVFHPDYSLICKQVNQDGRWSFFMYFLDMYSKLRSSISLNCPLVFDRSSLCGSIYNNDATIAIEYAKKIKDIKALHILVTVDSKETYYNLVNVRGVDTDLSYEDYLIHTERYRSYMDILGIDYVEYVNKYEQTLGDYLKLVCGGCSHFKSGKCINDKSGKDKVNFDDERCEYSDELEVQD